MAPILYMTGLGPSSRAIMMVAKAIGLELEYRVVQILEEKHRTEECLKINPQHTLPTLIDDDAVISESHAINAYLVGKYAKNDSLYPKDLAKRAYVDQRLHFDNGVLFSLLRQICLLIYLENVKIVPEDKMQQIHECYELMEAFLKGKKWIAGDDLSIADLSCITTITSLQFFFPIDEENMPNLQAWLIRTMELPCYAENVVGVKKFYELFKYLMEN